MISGCETDVACVKFRKLNLNTRLVKPLSGTYMIHSCDQGKEGLNSLIVVGNSLGGSWMTVSQSICFFN